MNVSGVTDFPVQILKKQLSRKKEKEFIKRILLFLIVKICEEIVSLR